ncbi:MAG: F420-nonreducing hydrogenase [Gemmatimonadales bacterium]|jgi:F420-non-reducing hydrogenase small subunit
MTKPEPKPKVAFYWCASCGGCEEAVVDLAEGILDIVGAVDIVMWPVAMDFKRADIETMPDESILASFINGAIRTTEQEEMASLLRRKSKLVIAFGACSQLGGIPGLANLHDREGIYRAAYLESPSTENPRGTLPRPSSQQNGHELSLPGFFETVRALDQVIDVDYAIPGCAPHPQVIQSAVATLLSGELPPKGTVLAPDQALCEECPRRESKPLDLSISEFSRPHEILIDEEMCLLAQGLVCLGPATRAGCGAACVSGNMPCSGCSGPTSRVLDHGGKAISGIASLIGADDEEGIDRILEGIPDPVGTFYRYGLPASLLRRKTLS